MEPMDDLLGRDLDSWLTTLPAYQQRTVRQLLSSSGDPLEAASKWLAAAPGFTSPFGGKRNPRPLVNQVIEEIRGLLCGDPKYEKDRAQIAEKAGPTQAWLVSTVTVALAAKLGTASAVLAPVVVLVFVSFGKCTLNAVCKVWNEQAAKRAESPG